MPPSPVLEPRASVIAEDIMKARAVCTFNVLLRLVLL